MIDVWRTVSVQGKEDIGLQSREMASKTSTESNGCCVQEQRPRLLQEIEAFNKEAES